MTGTYGQSGAYARLVIYYYILEETSSLSILVCDMSSPYTSCDYLSRKGLCGKRCYGGRCRTHRKRESLTACRNGCGKGTSSISGYCGDKATCGWRQNDELYRIRARSREMEAFIDELLASI